MKTNKLILSAIVGSVLMSGAAVAAQANGNTSPKVPTQSQITMPQLSQFQKSHFHQLITDRNDAENKVKMLTSEVTQLNNEFAKKNIQSKDIKEMILADQRREKVKEELTKKYKELVVARIDLDAKSIKLSETIQHQKPANEKFLPHAKISHDKNVEQIMNNNTGIMKNTTLIDSNKTNITQNTTDINTNKTHIAHNAAGIKRNESNIAKNSQDIKSLRSDLNHMGKRVNGASAMNMATSALFQPYNIGKVNVTAGLGHYDNANAVALGMGYRVNEQIAVRANVAYEDATSNMGFGVGANYEF